MLICFEDRRQRGQRIASPALAAGRDLRSRRRRASLRGGGRTLRRTCRTREDAPATMASENLTEACEIFILILYRLFNTPPALNIQIGLKRYLTR